MTDAERDQQEIGAQRWMRNELAKGRTQEEIDHQMEFEDFPVESVPLNRVKVSQETLTDSVVEQYRQMIRAGQSVTQSVWVTEQNGWFYVWDGNHRVSAAFLEGLKTAPMKVQHLPEVK